MLKLQTPLTFPSPNSNTTITAADSHKLKALRKGDV